MKSLLLVVLLLAASAVAAGDEPAKPFKRDLHVNRVFDRAAPPEYLYEIGAAKFRSLDELKRHLATWPRGSELRWAPGCMRLAGELPEWSQDDLAAFREFLEEHGIRFVVVPSG